MQRQGAGVDLASSLVPGAGGKDGFPMVLQAYPTPCPRIDPQKHSDWPGLVTVDQSLSQVGLHALITRWWCHLIDTSARITFSREGHFHD